MKIYRLLFLVGILALGQLQRSYAQYATWSRPLAPAVITARSVTDLAGNTYVAGSYHGALTMGATTLPAPTTINPTGLSNVSNAFVAKINPRGLVEWVLAGSSAKRDEVLALTLDPNGNVYAVFQAGLDSINGAPTNSYSFSIGTRTLPLGGIMLAKIGPTGTVAALDYLHQGSTRAEVTALTTDGAGNCLISVASYQAEVFGPYTFPRVGSNQTSTYSSAILQLNPTGTVSLVQALVPMASVQSIYYLRVEDLKVGQGGNLYCAGRLYGAATLGTAPAVSLSASGSNEGAFVARYSPTGVAQWGIVNTVVGGTAGSASNLSLAVAPTGEAYVAGNAAANVAFGGLAAGTRGGYVLKLSAAGVPQWVRGALTSNLHDGTKSAVRLVLDAAGNVYRLGLFDFSSVAFGSFILNHPLASSPGQQPYAFYIVSYDAAGTVRWARAVDGVQTPPATIYHQGMGLGCDAQSNLYVLSYLSYFNSSLSQLHINGQILSKGYTALRLSPAGRLSGTLYIDQNNNGSRDAGEIPFPQVQVLSDLVQGASYSSAPVSGQYSFFGLPGAAFSVTVPSPHPYYTLHAPTVLSGTFPAVGQTTSGLDFGLVPDLNQTDVRVTLTPYERARPGFTTRYRLTLENVGTTTASGTATVTLDNRMAYINSTPSGTVAGQVITWPYTSLAPFSQLEYDILFSLPTNTVLGTTLLTTATAPLTGDVTPADNTASLPQTVVGAFDPNSIEVNYERLTPAQVAARQPLDYTIHFQNLGTAAASLVILSDTLDFQKLDPASLMLVAQSHNCIWSLTSTGPNTGLLTVRFLNINLPERNVDVIRSQGFVRFRVQPRPTLALGEVIPNRAGIVFDFNDPVITNTAITTVFLATAALARHEAAAWTAYPNPATDAVTLATDLTTAGPVRIELLDVLGRPVRQQTLTAPAGPLRQTLDLRGLAAGIYVLRLTPPTGPATSRRVVRE